jgi:hypothetical protein
MEGPDRHAEGRSIPGSHGGKAQVKHGKWVPGKVKNTVCNPDDASGN